MSHPSVSVVIPCFNCAGFVGATIESVLAQKMARFEVVAVDDGSTDETRSVLTRYASDSRVRVLTLNRSHGGPAKARNEGLSASTGDFVMLLDSDDRLRPKALSALIDFGNRAPDAGLVFFNASIIDFETGECRGQALDDYHSFRRLSRRSVGRDTFVIDDSGTYRQLVRTNFIKTSGTSIRREILNEVGGFDERLTNADDWDLWLRIARNHRIGLIASPEVVYHLRRGNISSRGRGLLPNQILVLEKQLASSPDRKARVAIMEQLAIRHASLGWALRQEGLVAAARREYWRSWHARWNVMAVRGWIAVWLSTLDRRKPRVTQSSLGNPA